MKKILVAAHRPPPFHGQSFIVQQLLDGLHTASAGDIQVIHVDIRFSRDVKDIGHVAWRKIFLLAGFAIQIFFVWLKHRPDYFYYVPAPGKKVAVYRDFALVGLAKGLAMRRVFHWLAGGLSEWVQLHANKVEKRLANFVYGGSTLSIIPVESERGEASFFNPLAVVKIPTGIPDACQEFDKTILLSRRQRLEQRKTILRDLVFPSANTLQAFGKGISSQRNESENVDQPAFVFQALFMALCSEDKGVFDAMHAVSICNAWCVAHSLPLRVGLQLFGKFPTLREETQFQSLAADRRWQYTNTEGIKEKLIHHKEFVYGEEKALAFSNADVLCFPSYYAAESIPTVILDALAYGLPVVSTDWRGIPELLPSDALKVCKIKNPVEIAQRLVEALVVDNFKSYREEYLNRFTVHRFLKSMAAGLVQGNGEEARASKSTS